MTGVGSGLPTPAVEINPESAPFWAAAGDGRLMLTRCTSCSSVIWYPRAICPVCHTEGTEWFEAAGLGHVYAFSIVRRSPGVYSTHVPYVLAYVELDEGPRIMTNIVGCDPESVSIGQRLRATFDAIGDGNGLVRFRPE
jgi:uncharacterized OB-fold protein